jgi:putative Mn2+ efflux pump MntP
MSTSIDAVIIGMTLSLLTDNVPLTLMIIGATTFTLTLTGLHFGGKIGAHAGHRVELAGGVGLIGIGACILFQHIILA